MKVRHKSTGIELLVLHELENGYRTVGGSMIHRRDHEWEKVLDDPYQDVTQEYALCDGATEITLLRGEHFTYINCIHNGPAFIVERKKEK